MISETEQNLCCYEELLGRSGLLRCCHEFDYSKPKESWRLSPWPELTKQEMGLHTPHQVLLAPKPFAPTCHGPLPAFLACHLCARSPPPKMAGRSTAGRSSACRWRNLHSCCPAFGPLHQSLHTKRAMFSGDRADPRGSAPGDAETLLLPEFEKRDAYKEGVVGQDSELLRMQNQDR